MHNFYLMAFCLMLSSLTISAQNEVRKENFQLVHDEVVNSPSTVPDSRKYPPESDPYAGVTKNGVYAVGTPGTSFLLITEYYSIVWIYLSVAALCCLHFFFGSYD